MEYLVNSKNIKEYNVETNFALDFALLSHLQYRQWNGKLGKHFQIKIQFRLKACHRPSHSFLYFNCLEIYKPAEMQTGLVLRRALKTRFVFQEVRLVRKTINKESSLILKT